MFSSSLFKFIALFILMTITRSSSAPNMKRTKTHKKNVYVDANEKFSNLLTNMADNEKRFTAFKDYSELDSYEAGNGILRDLKNNRMTVLSKNLTKDIIYVSLLDGICKGGISLELTQYKEIIFRVKKKNVKLTEAILNEKYLKSVVNKVLREMICKNPQITATGLDLTHNNDDFETGSFEYNGNGVRSIKPYLNKMKKLETVQKYVQSRHYKTGSAILKERGDSNNDHVDEIILMNDRSTKAVIADVIFDMICTDGIYPELRGYNTFIKARKRENNFDLLMSNDEITKNIVKLLLKDMICNRTKVPENETSHKRLKLPADYYDDSIVFNDVVDRIKSPKHMTDKHRPEPSNLPQLSYLDITSDANNTKKNNPDDLNEDNDVFYENKRFETNYDEKRNNLVPNDIYNTMGSLRSSNCRKKAIEKCKKACKRTLCDVCEEYECSRSMKKAFTKRCECNCKDVYDD